MSLFFLCLNQFVWSKKHTAKFNGVAQKMLWDLTEPTSDHCKVTKTKQKVVFVSRLWSGEIEIKYFTS